MLIAQAAVAALTTAMIIDTTTAGTINITAVNGAIPAKHVADIYTDTGSVILVFAINETLLTHQASELHTLLHRASADTPMINDMTTRLLILQRRLRSDLAFFHDATARRGRSLATWLAGIFGLYNSIELSQLKNKEESTRQAVRTVTHHVEVLEDYAKNTNENMDNLARATQKGLTLVNNRVQLEILFEDICQPLRAISRVATAATEHRLHPAITDIIDVSKTWATMTNTLALHGRIPALTHVQQLFQLQASFWTNGSTIHIAVEIPTRAAAATPLPLLHISARPIFIDGLVYDLQHGPTYLARDNNTGMSLSLTEEDISACNQVGRTYYCSTAFVSTTDAAHGCLTALFLGETDTAKNACLLTVRPPRFEAWTIDYNTFLTITPNHTVLTITCNGSRTAYAQLLGMQLVWLPRDCQATTPQFQLHTARHKTNKAVYTATIREDFLGIISPNNSLPGDVAKAIRRPVTLTGLQAEVDRQLAAGEPTLSAITILAIALAAMAVAGLAAIAFWLSVRAPRKRPVLQGHQGRNKLRRHSTT
jgi:hypothetical protein